MRCRKLPQIIKVQKAFTKCINLMLMCQSLMVSFESFMGMNLSLNLILDETCLANINLRALEAKVKTLSVFKVTSERNRIAWALKAMTLTDLTTLSGDDCQSNVERLCIRASYPFSKHSIIADDSNDKEFLKQLHVAAVCVYPTKVKNAHDALKRLNMLDLIQIAAVATGFPSGL